MTGDYKWIKDEKDADFMYGGERFTITAGDIERLINGDILNFLVNDEYGCTLKYEPTFKRLKGQWIPNYTSQFRNPGRQCSICGKIVVFSENFCPNCGADMRPEHE